MDRNATADTIRRFRVRKGMTQAALADQIGVSPKTVSKWETGKGLPDISLLGAVATALDVSVVELMAGNAVSNRNISGNMLRAKFYCCPICGNIIHTMGEAVVSCCGVVLPPLEAVEADREHEVRVEQVEDEQFVTVRHDMTKAHYISFLAVVTSDRLQLVKLYPEGNAQCRFQIRGRGYLYLYCSRHGLMKRKI